MQIRVAVLICLTALAVDSTDAVAAPKTSRAKVSKSPKGVPHLNRAARPKTTAKPIVPGEKPGVSDAQPALDLSKKAITLTPRQLTVPEAYVMFEGYLRSGGGSPSLWLRYKHDKLIVQLAAPWVGDSSVLAECTGSFHDPIRVEHGLWRDYSITELGETTIEKPPKHKLSFVVPGVPYKSSTRSVYVKIRDRGKTYATSIYSCTFTKL